MPAPGSCPRQASLCHLLEAVPWASTRVGVSQPLTISQGTGLWPTVNPGAEDVLAIAETWQEVCEEGVEEGGQQQVGFPTS